MLVKDTMKSGIWISHYPNVKALINFLVYLEGKLCEGFNKPMGVQGESCMQV
jgi:hypothetical protein